MAQTLTPASGTQIDLFAWAQELQDDRERVERTNAGA